MKTIDGGITASRGFLAAGLNAGIKEAGPDLALIVSEFPAELAGTFTTNRIQGPCVRLCRERLTNGETVSAVVVNSANANACTGEQGMADCERMAATAAAALGLAATAVLVSSTGPIGVPMPMAKVEAGIRRAAAALSRDGGNAAARAIMTTDTVEKEFAVEIDVEGVPVRVGGMAKGSGMIEPKMATMLAFLTTDAAVEREALQACLRSAVDAGFNRITVDGDQSCNDTVLLLANGAAGTGLLNEEHPAWTVFREAVHSVALQLALAIVKDGEGATKFVSVNVRGAATAEDAEKAARTVANSLLVKTSWTGGDPNWGRVIDAVGRSGAEVVEERVDIFYDDLCSVHNGQACAGGSREDLAAVLAQDAFEVTVDLGLGRGRATVYTCDCSVEYVRNNSAYLT